MSDRDAKVIQRVEWLEWLVLYGRHARLLTGVAVALLSYQVMIHHGGLTSLDGVSTLVGGLILYTVGMVLTLRPIADIWTESWEVGP